MAHPDEITRNTRCVCIFAERNTNIDKRHPLIPGKCFSRMQPGQLFGYMLMKLARWLQAAVDVSSNSFVPNVPFEPFVDKTLLLRQRLRTESFPNSVRRRWPLCIGSFITWDTTGVLRYHEGLRRRPKLFPVCEVHRGVVRLDESHLTEINILLRSTCVLRL